MGRRNDFLKKNFCTQNILKNLTKITPTVYFEKKHAAKKEFHVENSKKKILPIIFGKF